MMRRYGYRGVIFKTLEKLAEIHSGGSGAHHFAMFTPASMLELFGYVIGQFNCELIYF